MERQQRARRLGHGQLLGIAVRRRREALGLTQEELAERIGGNVEANYVTHLETGRRFRLPEQPLFGRLAVALGARQVDLLREAGFVTDEADKPAVGVAFPHGSLKHVALMALVDLRSEDDVRAVARLAGAFLADQEAADAATAMS